MGRKNSRVQTTRMPRRDRGELKRDRSQPRESVEDLIIPDGTCRFQGRPKARFATREKAQTALSRAQRDRARTGSGHVEKRVYACPEGGCGGWHLTSREAYSERR